MTKSAVLAKRRASCATLEEFQEHALQEFDLLFAEMAFLCEREVVMHHHEASKYDRLGSRLDLTARFIAGGAMLCLAVGAYKVKWGVMNLNTPFGFAALNGLVLAGLLDYLARGSGMFWSTMRQKADNHKKALAQWQCLVEETHSYRIQLSDPRYEAMQYSKWFRKLIKAKEKATLLASVPVSTTSMFESPEAVINYKKDNRLTRGNQELPRS
ncbi:hypothetical protein Bpfe_007262 [Biomphalaria pfeifferi]|uniref:Uncharacterized protein n=1 Tax=Biomphalaria pfeifferi TaxID=112525 RepID=A0AAD8FGZ6_BIOPF|nr:hypothetical protein Bpfe_007262 [Biomphalaria pfeifferi]